MVLIAVLATSIVLQFVALVLTVRQVRVSGRWRAWTLIAVTLSLMAVRRCISFYGLVAGELPHPLELQSELIGLVTSALVVLGLLYITRLLLVTRRSQEELRETRDHLDNLLDYANAPIIVWDPQFRVTRFNHALERLTGRAADELMGGPLAVLFPDEQREDSLALIERTAAGERWEGVEIPILRTDGTVRTVLWNSATLYGEDGTTVVATIAQGQDITERRWAEERIEHLNAVMGAIRGVNQLIVREKDRDNLLQQACDILTSTRGYRAAWIALMDEDGGFLTLAGAGLGGNFPALVEMLQAGELPECAKRSLGEGGGLTLVDPSTCECPLAGREPGWMGASVSLEWQARVYGVLTLCLPAQLATDEQEQYLVREVANDLAFALRSLELEAERKRAEEALRESEAHYRSLVENAVDLIYCLDLQKKVSYVSPQLLSALGYVRKDLLGRSSEVFIAEEDRARTRAAFERRMRAEHVPPYEFRLRRKDGSCFPVEIVANPVYSVEGDVVGNQVILRDITERKRAEGALLETAARLQAIFEAAKDVSFVITDLAGTEAQIVEFSSGAEHIFGYTREEAVGQPAAILHLPEDVAGFPRSIEGLRQRKASLTQETVLVRKSGERFPALLTLYPLKDDKGELNAVLGVTIDITERKRAEEALRGSERDKALILSSLSELVLYHDRELRIIWTNRAAGESVGLPAEQLVGCHCYEVWNQREEPCVGCPVLEALETGRPREAEMTTPDGKWWSVKGYPVCGDDGDVVGAVEVTLDITERKRAEQALREARDRAQEYLDVAGVMLLVIDETGEVTLINEKGCSILGCEEEEVVGQNWFDVFLPQSHKEEVKGVYESLMAGDIAPVEYYENPVVTKSGGERVIAWHNTVLRDETGNIMGILCSGEDISERKQAEEALRESEAHYRALVENAVDMVYCLNLEGELTYVSPALLSALGYTREELIGKFSDLIIAEGDRPRTEVGFQRRITGEHVPPYEFRLRCKDGSYLPVEIAGNPIHSPDGEVVGVQGILRDVSERRRLEREVVKVSQEEQQRIAQDLHDGLGQRLTGIAFLSKVLEEKLTQQAHPQAPEAGKITDLVNKALAEARALSHGLSPVSLEEGGLAAALGQLTADVEEVFGVSCRFLCEQPVEVGDHAVATHLYYIAQEAVTNAVKHAQASEVSVELTAAEGKVTLDVTDDGTGLPDVPAGEGLGLRLMRHRADAIGASLEIRGRAEGGTAVICWLWAPSSRQLQRE